MRGVAQSPMMKTTITIARLKRKGYQSMLDVYFELNPSFCEPPYMRPVRTFLEEKSRGVRGSSR